MIFEGKCRKIEIQLACGQTLLSDCEGLFTSKLFGLGLLLAMVGLMLSFAHWRWCRPNGPGTGGLLQIISGQGAPPFPRTPHFTTHRRACACSAAHMPHPAT